MSEDISEEKYNLFNNQKRFLFATRPIIFLRSWFIVVDFYPTVVGKLFSKKFLICFLTEVKHIVLKKEFVFCNSRSTLQLFAHRLDPVLLGRVGGK